MTRSRFFQGKIVPALLPGATAVVAAVIFVADTITAVNVAVAAFYVAVVLMAARFFNRRGLILVAAGTIFLTVFSFWLSPPSGAEAQGLANTVISMAAVGVTTLLVLHSKSAEVTLREQADLLDLTHDSICVRGTDDVITYWNRGASELYGWTKEEAVGQVAHILMQTVFPLPLDEIKAELFRTGRWESEMTQTRRDGTAVTVASRWSLQRGGHGRPAMILETNNDITERKRVEQALHKLETELAHVARLTTIGELTASIIHEVNQPLTALITNSNTCLRWLTAQPANLHEAQECLHRMVRDGSRASEVLSRIRSLVKKSPMVKTRMDLNAAIQEVLAIVRPEAIQQTVRIRTELSAGLPPAYGDRVQVQQVVLNLVMNGIEAMREVTDWPREIRIRSRPYEPGMVLVTVEDTGPGLSAACLDHVFEAFYTTKAEGMGIGLSISRSIIDAHGGRLWTAASESHGATFQFTLPTHDLDEQGTAQLSAAPAL